MKAKNHPFPGLIVITSPNSSQIYSVHVARRFYSGEAEDGGRNVNVERNLGPLLPRLNFGSAHVERNFDVKLVRGRFAFYHAELSNVIAVVWREQEIRVVHLIQILDSVHHHFHSVVDW